LIGYFPILYNPPIHLQFRADQQRAQGGEGCAPRARCTPVETTKMEKGQKAYT
jgi:hypothetical protein